MTVFPGEGLKASVTVGLENWQDGKTTLDVDSQGHAEVVNRRAGTSTSYTGTLTPDELAAFAAALNGVAGLAREQKPRKPDDVPVRIRLLAGNKAVQEFAPFTYGDRYSIPAFNQLIRQFNRLVNQLSQGALSG